MANDLIKNPIYLETITGSEIDKILNIQSILWVHTEEHPITADSDLELKDPINKIIVNLRQGIAGESVEILFPKGLEVRGIKATKLDSGEVYIYQCANVY